jgi:hypothetical protein
VSIILNKKEFLSALSAEKGEWERKFSLKVRNVVYALHYEITSRTPVWSGQTLANYVWSVNVPYEGIPIEAPGTGPTGRTNSMALGVEPRRPESQEVADESLARLSFTNPYRVYWLANNDPTVGPLEAGEWPEPPFVQRSPQGMFMVSVEYVLALLDTGAI